MLCFLDDLKTKEVIDIKSGERLGFIDDVRINPENSEIVCFMIYGRNRFFGLFGKDDDIAVKCEDVKVIGNDVILIEYSEPSVFTNKRKKLHKSL